jgi:hypothetical protein
METNLIAQVVSSLIAEQDRVLRQIITDHAEPPIRGEITKGKLRVRGIKVVFVKGEPIAWVEQRGVQIGPRVNISLPDTAQVANA